MNENVNLLNQKDATGCTPLHLASEKGNLRFTESLIALGATINLKNNEDRSPLHFAARYPVSSARLNRRKELDIISCADLNTGI
jgi:ankyrin repeat protein